MKGLEIQTEARGDVLVATLVGEIDIVNHSEVGEELLSAALASGPYFVAELSGVRYVDSNGVRMLFELSRDLDHARITCAVALAAESPLQRLFKVTAFDEVVPIFPSADDAVESLRGGLR